MKNTDKFIKWIESLTDEEKSAISQKEIAETKKDFEDFVQALKKGMCSLCNSPIRTFSEETVCLHWLLKPKSIRKSHIELAANTHGYIRTNTYLRWAANSERRFQNINDCESIDENRIIEESISYQRLRWSFSCSKSDFEGHKNSMGGSKPHYHLAMWQDNSPFIRFNDFHLSFNDEDILYFELKKLNHKDIKIVSPYAWGMKEVFEWGSKEENQDQFIKGNPTSEIENAALHFSTILTAPENKTISGEDIYQAQKRAKEENTTITYQLKKLAKNENLSTTTIITPGNGVPNLDTRNKRGKNRKRDKPREQQ